MVPVNISVLCIAEVTVTFNLYIIKDIFQLSNGANGENTAEKSKEHGTHVSGTFAANADDSTGICGVYPYGRGNLYGASLTGVTNKKENGKFRKSVMSLKVAFGELIIRNAKVINFSIGFNYRSNDFTYFDLFVDRKGLIASSTTLPHILRLRLRQSCSEISLTGCSKRDMILCSVRLPETTPMILRDILRQSTTLRSH
ncbi:MAG: S8 family serine peptidase [Ruminococcus sp.]|nr:S8 family serine peptidase [Ruminococcus sp.]